MQIKDVMSQEYTFISPDANLAEAAAMMQQQDIGFLPVGENDRLIGALTDRDIVTRSVAQGQNPAQQNVREVMSQGVKYCFDDQTVEEICQNMAQIKMRRLPVVNREKRLVGTVSLGDLAQVQQQQTGQALQSIVSKCCGAPQTCGQEAA